MLLDFTLFIFFELVDPLTIGSRKKFTKGVSSLFRGKCGMLEKQSLKNDISGLNRKTLFQDQRLV